jgi:hypothetical protein
MAAMEPQPTGPEPDVADEALVVTEEYRASPRYWVLAVAGLGATALLLVDMLRGVRWDTVLFAAVGVIGGLWALWMATTRVYVADDGLVVKRFTASYKIDYRQMLSADRQGRVLGVLSILFHPRRADGLIDTEQVGSMLIPALVDQDQLIDLLAQRIPH